MFFHTTYVAKIVLSIGSSIVYFQKEWEKIVCDKIQILNSPNRIFTERKRDKMTSVASNRELTNISNMDSQSVRILLISTTRKKENSHTQTLIPSYIRTATFEEGTSQASSTGKDFHTFPKNFFSNHTKHTQTHEQKKL